MSTSPIASSSKIQSALENLGIPDGFIAYDTIPLLRQLVVALGNVTTSGGGGDASPTGTRLTGYWVDAPDGYVLANGSTIGNAASGATRANADTEALFSLLWEMWNTLGVLGPSNLFDNSGVGVTPSGTASEDYALNRRIQIPDERLRVPVMAHAGTNLAGVNGKIGATGGEETHTLLEGELPVVPDHYHTVNFAGATGDDNSRLLLSDVGDLAVSTNPLNTTEDGGFGNGDAHNNVQPFICINVAIKL